MKKLLLVCLATPFFSASQIKGIGEFRIHTSKFQIIDSLAKANSIRVIKNAMSSIDGGSHITTRIIEIVPDSNDRYTDPYSYRQPFVNVVYINYLDIGGVGADNIFLTFYKGSLVKIMFSPSVNIDGQLHIEFQEAMISKYGKPKIKKESKIIYCQNGFGATTENKEEETQFIWNTGIANISAKQVDAISYDEHCKADLINIFTIEDFKIIDVLNQKEGLLNNKKENENKKERLGLLHDF